MGSLCENVVKNNICAIPGYFHDHGSQIIRIYEGLRVNL